MRADTRTWTRRVLPVLLSILLGIGIGIGAGGVATADPGRTQNIVDTAPGTVDSVQPLAAEAGLPGTARAHLLTYWTVGPTGLPALSSGTVFVPNGQAPAGGWPVISWAHGTVGVGDRCAPSRNPYQGRHLEYLSHWISEGYAVVATDYAGLGTPGPHAYLET